MIANALFVVRPNGPPLLLKIPPLIVRFPTWLPFTEPVLFKDTVPLVKIKSDGALAPPTSPATVTDPEPATNVSDLAPSIPLPNVMLSVFPPKGVNATLAPRTTGPVKLNAPAAVPVRSPLSVVVVEAV